MSNKYQIIVEAVVKNTPDQKTLLQTAINTLAKDMLLTIEKITLSSTALEGIQAQINKALSGGGTNKVPVNVDQTKLNKTSKDIEKGIADGGKRGAVVVAETLVTEIQDAVDESISMFQKFKEKVGTGFELKSVAPQFGPNKENQMVLEGYNVTIKKIGGDVNAVATGFARIAEYETDILEITKGLAQGTKDYSANVEQWGHKVQRLKNQYQNTLDNPVVKKSVRELDIAMDKALGSKKLEDINKLNKAYENTKTHMSNVRAEQNRVSAASRTMLNMFQNALQKVALWFGATTLFYGALKQFRDMITYIKDLNKELTNIQVVTDMSTQGVKNLAGGFNDLAKEMGVTTLEVTKGSLEWFRQGKTIEETTELMRASLIQSKLGNVEAAQSTEYLTSVLNGFKLEAEDAIRVVDMLVNLDNRYATSVSEIASALQRSSNSAGQAGVTLEELASYITVLSSVTRKSAESIGESFKTMFARMQNIKLGKAFEDDATSISDVETALKYVNIELRNSDTSFRDMGDVLDDIAAKWSSLNDIEQSAVANAIAGVRQRENFLVLMNNYNEVLQAQAFAADSAGLANQRYSIYLDSVEASTNRMRAAWESLATSFLSDELIKGFADVTTAVLNVVEAIGILRVALIALATYAGVKIFLAEWVVAFFKFFEATTAATAAVTAFQVATGLIIFTIVIAGIYGLTKAFEKLNMSITDTRKAFAEEEQAFKSSMEELDGLENAYESLAKKIDKTDDDLLSLVDIVSRLNTEYGMVSSGVDLYSDAVEGNNEVIETNIGLMEEARKLRVQEFVDLSKLAYEKSKKFLNSPQLYEADTKLLVGQYFKGDDPQEVLAQLRKKAELESDSEGYWHRQHSAYKQMISDAEELVRKYEIYVGLLNEEEDVVSSGRGSINFYYEALKELGFSIFPRVNEGAKDFQETFKALSDEVSFGLGIYEQYIETQKLSVSQILDIITRYPEYLDLLSYENGQLVLNAQAIKEITLARIEDQIILLKEQFELDKKNMTLLRQIGLLRALKVQIRENFNEIDRTTDSQKELNDAQDEYNKKLNAEMANIQEKAYQDLLRMTISMIREKKEAEKAALQEQLDNYKKIIDAQKTLLDMKEKERDYDREKKNQNKVIANIENELMELQFDTSEEGTARRLQLEEQLAEEKDKLGELEHDRSIELQKDALDTEYENYKESMDARIAVLEKYLSQSGQITQDAISMLSTKSDAFYQSLINWNRQFGTGVDTDVVGAWNRAFVAASTYAAAVANIGLGPNPGIPRMTTPSYGDQGDLTGKRIQIDSDGAKGYFTSDAREEKKDISANRYYVIKEYDANKDAPYKIAEGGEEYWIKSRDLIFSTFHKGLDSGWVGDLKSNEEFAKLLKGELVIDPPQMNEFMDNILPKTIESASSGFQIGKLLEVNVNGGVLDHSVLPEINRMVDAAIGKLNKMVQKKGNMRNANSYSI